MLGTVFNIFKISDLRSKIFFTILMLAIYRVGFHIPIPGFDQSKAEEYSSSQDTDSPAGRAAAMMRWL